MRDKEKYETKEHSKQGVSGERRGAETAAVSPETVESVARQQAEMIEAIQKYVPVSLVESLRLKVTREQQLLRESIENEQRTIMAAKKTINVLSQKFFRVVPMEQQLLD